MWPLGHLAVLPLYLLSHTHTFSNMSLCWLHMPCPGDLFQTTYCERVYCCCECVCVHELTTNSTHWALKYYLVSAENTPLYFHSLFACSVCKRLKHFSNSESWKAGCTTRCSFISCVLSCEQKWELTWILFLVKNCCVYLMLLSTAAIKTLWQWHNPEIIWDVRKPHAPLTFLLNSLWQAVMKVVERDVESL